MKRKQTQTGSSSSSSPLYDESEYYGEADGTKRIKIDDNDFVICKLENIHLADSAFSHFKRDPPPTIETLPKEILIAIFKLLPWSDLIKSIPRVNRTWAKIYYDAVSHIEVHTSNCNDGETLAKLLARIGSKFTRLRSLSIEGRRLNNELNADTANSICTHFKTRLTKLRLSSLRLHQSSLDTIIQELTALKTLEIIYCNGAFQLPSTLSHSTLLPNLEAINLTGGSSALSANSSAIFRMWPKLSELTVTINSFEEVAAIVQYLPLLRKLHLKSSYVSAPDCETIKMIAQLKELEDLSMDGFADYLVLPLEPLSSRLQRLSICNSPWLTDSGLYQISKLLTSLRSLSISFASVGGGDPPTIDVRSIIMLCNLPYLHHLELKNLCINSWNTSYEQELRAKVPSLHIFPVPKTTHTSSKRTHRY